MVATTLNRTGSRLLARGFRPFFLATAAYSLVVIAIWTAVLMGWLDWQSRLDPLAWHAHEMLFGAIGAAIAGFLLTAVPNWTGRLPVAGARLGLLASLWLLPRLLWPLPGTWVPALAGGIELAFWGLLLATVAREILLSGNRRNLPVVTALALVLIADTTFAIGALTDEWMTMRRATLAMLALAILLVSLIGGRIVPSFTHNWLKRRGASALPRSSLTLDAASLGLSAGGLALWLAEQPLVAGPILLAAATAQLLRLSLWRGWSTFGEPLVAILHLAYLWIPVGLALLGAAQLWPQVIAESAALHALGA
ncbi:MAG TPA: NnrS family protein, partial [Kiloniellales bacterium]|nr:NnrS family protein [Kiloniellales bacterium]